MSVGNQVQAIDFSNKSLVLVIGENMDLGGDDAGARNGTGKTTIINALSYVFFGEALTNIRRDNLVNKTNEKGMLVGVKFVKNGITYTIERGRKPQIFRFYANDIEQKTESNEAQGENRETQVEINKLMGMTHSMFKNIIALNTYTQPFLSTKQAEQREIIEQLLGITLLSQKADLLKEKQKATKQMLTEEKLKIDARVASNEKIQESIESLQIRSNAWTKQKDDDIKSFRGFINDFAYWDKPLQSNEIQELYKSQGFSLLNDYEQYSSSENLKTYYDFKHLKLKSNYVYDEGQLLNLKTNEYDAEVSHCIPKTIQSIERKEISIPARRQSNFEMLKHETTGYFYGTWKSESTRLNQIRFYNQIRNNETDLANDGLTSLHFKGVSKTEQDNYTFISVEL